MGSRLSTQNGYQDGYQQSSGRGWRSEYRQAKRQMKREFKQNLRNGTLFPHTGNAIPSNQPPVYAEAVPMQTTPQMATVVVANDPVQAKVVQVDSSIAPSAPPAV